ncbi:hypothetical protein [Sphingobacterium sp. xlx-130]|uniref:hypothetical protein n=1 Tax=Sphingobacterium sp. xlx-130 TaxID=2654323 RepID=UPI0013DD68EF|nr:hypothetical protein [Sphingobacterium sp. xlx-130]
METEIADVISSFSQMTVTEQALEKLLDKADPTTERIAQITLLQDCNYHQYLTAYLTVVAGKNKPTELRAALTGILGDFTYSSARNNIVMNCQAILKTRIPKELKNQIGKTINKLN